MKMREFNNFEEGYTGGGYNPAMGDCPQEYVDGVMGKAIVPYRKWVSFQTKRASKLLQRTGKARK